MNFIVWWVLYFMALFFVPKAKVHKGYGWSFLRRWIYPWKWIPAVYPDWREPLHSLGRLLALGCLLWPLAFFQDEGWVWFYLAIIVLALDDYVNGDDDDRKKRHEWVKNKIKWLMQLPAPPQEVKVRS